MMDSQRTAKCGNQEKKEEDNNKKEKRGGFEREANGCALGERRQKESPRALKGSPNNGDCPGISKIRKKNFKCGGLARGQGR